jgi:hypothetical protein
MANGLWSALGGYALGSAQVLLLDWWRARSQHRRQLRLLRAELRRLDGYRTRFNWKVGAVPESDTIPNSPRVTPGYTRLVQEMDFWLTDEHSDDNTQQGLLDIADGCAVLERYVSDVLKDVDKAGDATTQVEKEKWRTRATQSAGAHDKEHERWLIMVSSVVRDVERRIREAKTLRQAVRTFRPMPKGANPPPLPPVQHDEQ